MKLSCCREHILKVINFKKLIPMDSLHLSKTFMAEIQELISIAKNDSNLRHVSYNIRLKIDKALHEIEANIKIIQSLTTKNPSEPDN